MRIRAAVLEQSGLPPPYAESLPLKLREVELDGPGHGEVLVRIEAAGLCHSDLSVIEGNRPRPLPMVLGHEGAGIVEELGPGVDDLVPGDHVVVVFVPSCGVCPHCAEGRPALCGPGAIANGNGVLLSGARRLHAEGGELNHHLGGSVFADYATVSRRSLVRVDRSLPFEHAALFGCAVLTGVGAVVNSARVSPGSSVAILGLGGVGLAALMAAKAVGAERIVAIDLNPDKLATARLLGATDAFLGDDTVRNRVIEATVGGVDVAVELAGSVTALALAYGITRRGGAVTTAGLPPPTAALSIPAASLVADEKTIRGSYLGSCVPSRDVPRFIRMFQRGILPVDRLVSKEMRLEDINAGFDRLREGSLIRGVVRPHPRAG